jgi:hypothetical protein
VVEQTYIPVKIALESKPARSETVATSVGAYVLVIDTVMPDHAISLHSTYAGHTHTKTLASHLLLASGAYDAVSAEHEHDEMPIMYARRRCLYDHLHHLQDLLDRLGIAATIPVEDAAIAAVEH